MHTNIFAAAPQKNIQFALTTSLLHTRIVITDKDNPETESSFKFLNNLSQDTLEGKGKSNINFENLSFSFLKKTKSKYPKNFIFENLNINSIRNKFESVQKIIQNTFDFFLFSETIIDSSFLSQQFSIKEY